MSPTDSFDALMARLRQGEDDAAAELLSRFANRLIALARVRLGVRTRAKVDPEDVLQSVFKSFFLRCAHGQFDLHDWDDLWALLVTITLHKCGHQVQHLYRARRDVRRETPQGNAADGSTRPWEALARDPSPEEEVALADEVDALLRSLNERDRSVVCLWLRGHRPSEIATQLGVLERTVFRVLERVRRRLREQYPGIEKPKST